MKKFFGIVLVAAFALSAAPAFALDQSLYHTAVSVEDANADKVECKAVYIGATATYEFNMKNSKTAGGTGWVSFPGATAGTIIPIRAIGARDADDSAPEAGDVLFLY